MAVYTTVSTVSHGYYMRKRKNDIRFRIDMLAESLELKGISLDPVSDDLERVRDNPNLTAFDLASVAMKLHELFPSEGTEEDNLP